MTDYHVLIRELPGDQKPRERLRSQGAAALSDAELLAILLRVGVEGASAITIAQQLLRDMGGWQGLQRAGFEELCHRRGMGTAKTAQLKAALEIARRLLIATAAERPQIRAPSDAAQLMQVEMSHLDQEHLRTICLDTKNRVQKVQTVYVGSLNASMVRIGEVFKEAIRLNSAAIIVVHNHPSGDPTPSPEDTLVTRQIVEAGKLLDIDVLDHLIIGAGRFVSMRERGLGFSRSSA
ncbi:MAG TPA: DNA repair protein RadC [Roseiflexaceae bacterium]|nr:DNA repair protein RadC [Roseiflexaceae bacterium]HMP40637.1 DNA repair protein RadC [Roseiflexaceae bacterium]